MAKFSNKLHNMSAKHVYKTVPPYKETWGEIFPPIIISTPFYPCLGWSGLKVTYIPLWRNRTMVQILKLDHLCINVSQDKGFQT